MTVTVMGTLTRRSAVGAHARPSLGLLHRVRRHPLRLMLVGDLVAGLVCVLVVLAATLQSATNVVAGVLVWLLLMAANRVYEPMPAGLGDMRLSRVLRACTALGLICFVVSALTPTRASPLAFVLLTGSLTVGAVGHRVVVRGLRLALRAPDRPTPVLVAGDPDLREHPALAAAIQHMLAGEREEFLDRT